MDGNSTMTSRNYLCLIFSLVFCCFSAVAQADDLRINGFLTVGAGQTDSDEFDSTGGVAGYSDEFSINEDTTLGLQFTQPINKKFTLNAQLLGTQGKSRYDLEASWVFFSFDATDELSFQGGRIRIPYFMYSQFVDVSYAYPWIRPPKAFDLPFSEIDGLTAYYSKPLDVFDVSVEAYMGELEVYDNPMGSFHLKDISGVVLTANTLDLTLRASTHLMTFQIDSIGGFDVGIDPEPSSFTELGFIYDNGKIFSFVEATLRRQPDELKQTGIFSDVNTYIATLGYRIEKIMPHVTYDLSDNQDIEEEATSIILGVRWDLEPSTAAKFQYQMEALDRDGNETEANLISASIDLVF